MPRQKTMSLNGLIPDALNANKHSDHGTKLLEKSITTNRFGRSILISNDNMIIAGNGVAEMAKQNGVKKVRIIETDGDELIAVRRTDIKSGTKDFFSMALADNIVSKANIVMDATVIAAIVEDCPTVSEWAEEVSPRTQSTKGNINHAQRHSITFNFSEADYLIIKDFINKSGVNAEQAIISIVKNAK